MHIALFVLFATCAAAGVAGGRKPRPRPVWVGSRPSREEAAEAVKYHQQFARHAEAARRPGWNRRGQVTKQALENVKYYTDKVARDATTALSAGAPFKEDPTETEEYWRPLETPVGAEAWPSVTDVLGQAVSGIQESWSAVTEAVQTRASDAVEHAKVQAEMQKREARAYGPAKRVKMHHPREVVYDRFDDLVEDEEGNVARDLVYDRYDNLVEDEEGNVETALDEESNVARDLVYDRYDDLVEDEEAKVERDADEDEDDAEDWDEDPEVVLDDDDEQDYEGLYDEADDETQTVDDPELDERDAEVDEEEDDGDVEEDEEEEDEEEDYPTPATTQPDAAQPQPSRVKHGHGHAHAHLHR